MAGFIETNKPEGCFVNTLANREQAMVLQDNGFNRHPML